MSLPAQIKRRELIRKFKKLDFEGPLPGSKHSYMKRDKLKVRIPNPHEGDIGIELLDRLLKQAGISKEDWMNA